MIRNDFETSAATGEMVDRRGKGEAKGSIVHISFQILAFGGQKRGTRERKQQGEAGKESDQTH
jgi:hypothetical protein